MGKLRVILAFLLVFFLSIQSIIGHGQEDQDSSEFKDATGENSDGNVEESTAPESASSPTGSFARPFGPEPGQAPDGAASDPTDGELDNNKAQAKEGKEYKDATGQKSDGNVEEATAPGSAGADASSPARSFARPFGPEPDQGAENSGATDGGGSGQANSEMAHEEAETEAEKPPAEEKEN